MKELQYNGWSILVWQTDMRVFDVAYGFGYATDKSGQPYEFVGRVIKTLENRGSYGFYVHGHSEDDVIAESKNRVDQVNSYP